MKKLTAIVAAVAVMVCLFATLPMTAFATGKGDYNNDGKITTADVREMMLTTVRETAPSQKQMWWGDYNMNGTIDTSDAREVLYQCLESDKTIDYANTDHTDWWGEKSVALLGDSISFGAGCSGEIANNSYAGIVKKAVNAANGSTNYGFMPAYTTNWSPRSDEICGWPTMKGGPGVTGNSEGWKENDNGDRLMYFGLTAYKQYASLTYKLRSGYNYKYVCVYYQTGPAHGSFTVANNTETGGYDQPEVDGITRVYDCENTVNATKRTGFFEVSNFTNGISLNIVSSDNQPVTITGLGFYNDISGNMVTFEKYTRGGAMLTPLSETVLSQAASAGTLILGLGYNDAFWGHEYGYTKEDFSKKIDYLIVACQYYGTNVIVNDYLWSNYKTLAQYQAWNSTIQAQIDEKFAFFHEELKRLARETKGIYVSQEERWGNELINYVNANDGVHPTNGGHALMAQTLLEAMGLA